MKPSRRRGGMLVEAMVAIMLVAFALAGVSQLLVLTGRQHRHVEARRLAHREAGNVMERVMARPDSQLSPENLAAIAVSPETGARLPNATVKIQVTRIEEGRTNEIRVAVAWNEFTGQAEQVEISAWKSVGSSP